MSGKASAVPDAWDDDWEVQADKLDKEEAKPEAPPKVSKAERLAKHAELNKKLWDSAESSEGFHYLATRNEVPLKTEFKPAVKVLSRKPTAPKPVTGTDGVAGMAQLGIDDLDDEEGGDKKQKLSPEEMMQKAQRDREEKQRRYEEAREKIFGPGNSGETVASRLPGPAAGGSGDDGGGRKSRARGNKDSGSNRESKPLDSATSSRSSSLKSRTRQVPSTEQAGTKKQLYDPNQSAKPPTVGIQRRPTEDVEAVQMQQPIRAPKGPDGTGRGGFGFVARGGETK